MVERSEIPPLRDPLLYFSGCKDVSNASLLFLGDPERVALRRQKVIGSVGLYARRKKLRRSEDLHYIFYLDINQLYRLFRARISHKIKGMHQFKSKKERYIIWLTKPIVVGSLVCPNIKKRISANKTCHKKIKKRPRKSFCNLA